MNARTRQTVHFSQFKQQVQDFAGKAVRPQFLGPAMDYFSVNGRTSRNDVEECVQLARRFQASLGENDLKATSPALLVNSDQLTEAIRPQVERARVKLFRKKAAPFPSQAKAEAWLRKQSREKTEGKTRVLVRTGKLLFLEGITQKLAEETKFSGDSLTAYILSDIAPVLPCARVKVETRIGFGIGLMGSWVSLELYDLGLTWEQFYALYRYLRETLHLFRSKPLTERDRGLLTLASSLGGEPAKGDKGRETRKAFWGKALDAWNKKHSRSKYTTWRGLEMAYRRLGKKQAAPKPGTYTLGEGGKFGRLIIHRSDSGRKKP